MSESPSKRHKKHKKHKHKRRHDEEGEEGILDDIGAEEEVDMSFDLAEEVVGGEEPLDVVGGSPPSQPPAIKLKIKLGGQTISTATSSIKKSSSSSSSSRAPPAKSPAKQAVQTQPGDIEGGPTPKANWAENKIKGDVFPTKKPGEDTSDEEQEWLDALEAGTLDDSGHVKKGKDLNLMTSRQRAMHTGEGEQLMQLPSGYKVTELTEEQLQRRQQRAKKRREQAAEKQEKDKKQTLDRLLKKQEAKLKNGRGRGLRRVIAPSYRYLSNKTHTTLSVPHGFQLPFPAQTEQPPPPPRLCGAKGCSQPRKYSCSKTGVPLCSLQCYRVNLGNSGLTHTPALVT